MAADVVPSSSGAAAPASAALHSEPVSIQVRQMSLNPNNFVCYSCRGVFAAQQARLDRSYYPDACYGVCFGYFGAHSDAQNLCLVRAIVFLMSTGSQFPSRWTRSS